MAEIGSSTQATPVIRVADTGLSVLYSPVPEDQAIADIIFVHGLQGHPKRTWTKAVAPSNDAHQDEDQPRGWRSKLGVYRKHRASSPSATSSSASTEVFWPADLLPKECPQARILTFGYNSSISNFFGPAVNQDSPSNVAKNLLFAVTRLRRKCPQRRLILVAHSLGGIVVKEALRRSAIAEDEGPRNFQTSLYGIVFMGVPHGGGNYQTMGEVMRRIVSAIGMDTNEKMLGTLKFESEDLLRAREEFTRLWRSRFKVKTFQEARGVAGIQGFNNKVVPDFSSTLNDPLERPETIDANHMEMCRFSGPEDAAYQQVSSELIDWIEDIGKIQATAADEQAQEMNEIEHDCLQSLSFPELEIRINEIDGPVGTTCQWMFQHPQYRTWLERENISSHSNILSLKGKVGSGKSVCCKAVFEHLQREASISPRIRVLHCFFTNRDPGSNAADLTGFLRSLLWQILQEEPFLFKDVLPIWEKKNNTYGEDWSWTTADLKTVLSSLATRTVYSRSFVVIDALDECSEVDELLEIIQGLTTSSGPSEHRFSWFLSSRHYPVVSIEKSLEISIDELNARDIDEYVTQRLGSTSIQHDFTTLLSEIRDRASGIFLWAVLVVKTLLRAKAEGAPSSEMVEIVRTLPKKLDDLIRAIFQSVRESQYSDVACRIMQWVAFATRPMTAKELAWAIEVSNETNKRSHKDVEKSPSFALDNIDRYVRARTKGLIEVKAAIKANNPAECKSESSTSSTIQFIHGSIREVLVRHRGFAQIWDHFSENPIVESHHMCAMTCVTYLGMRDFLVLKAKLQDVGPLSHKDAAAHMKELYDRFPLLEYAVDSLFTHVSHVGYAPSLIVASDVAMKKVTSIFKLWARLSDLVRRSRAQEIRGADITFSHVAAEFNLGGWMLDKSLDVNAVAGRCESLLATAAAFGHEALCQKLLLAGADANGPGGRYGCVLGAAASRGLTHLISDLLEHDCDVNADAGEFGTPLQAAASSFVYSLEVVQQLIDANADVNKIADVGGTPLQAASFVGNLDVVDLLLEAGADVNLITGEHGSALQAAASQGNEEVVELLLAHEADLDLECGALGSAVFAAACGGYEDVVRLLLEAKGVESESLDEDIDKVMTRGRESNAFYEAILSGDSKVVKSLLHTNGFDVNIPIGGFKSAFNVAAFELQHEIMKMLLDIPDAKPDVADHIGRTALGLAAAEGDLTMVELLLGWESAAPQERQLDFKRKTVTGKNLLWVPCARRKNEIVQLLLKKGVDAYEKDRDGDSPYDVADAEGKKLVVQYGIEQAKLEEGSEI